LLMLMRGRGRVGFECAGFAWCCDGGMGNEWDAG